MNYPKRPIYSTQHQQGTILLISLVLLAVITLLGLSSMKTALTGERIAGHVQDLHLANESAESALRRGQRRLRKTAHSITTPEMHTSIPLPDGAPENPDQPVNPPDLTNWASRAIEVAVTEMVRPAGDDSKTPVPQPLYKLELFDQILDEKTVGDSEPAEQKKQRGTSFYRVFSKGLGRSGENQVILQSLMVEGLAPPPPPPAGP